MTPLLALTTSIAVLGGIDTYLTGTILPIPVWVTFIAWASFFACGGGQPASSDRSPRTRSGSSFPASVCLPSRLFQTQQHSPDFVSVLGAAQ